MITNKLYDDDYINCRCDSEELFLTHADNTENESAVKDWLMMVSGRITKQKNRGNWEESTKSNKWVSTSSNFSGFLSTYLTCMLWDLLQNNHFYV